MNQLFTVKELSSFLNLYLNTICKRVEKGEIPFIKRKGGGSRFKKEEFDIERTFINELCIFED